MNARLFIVRIGGILVLMLAAAQCAFGVGSITGQGQFEKIAGNPSMGYKALYEWDLFLSPADNSMVGPFRRLGAPPGQAPTGDGFYRIDGLPAGMYSVFVNQPDFFASPKVVPDVEIKNGRTTHVNIDLDIDYSTYFHPGTYTDWGPWTWYQTFRATGTSVRAVSWVMAGWGVYKDKRAEVSILEDNGQSNVRNWTKLITAPKNSGLSSDSDQWIRWPSGQIKLTPGKMYAVAIWVGGGLSIYKRDKDSQSYKYGRAYDQDGNPKNFDLNITVFVDRNNQSVTHTRLGSGPGDFNGSLNDTRWGQTFVATGVGLAAVDLFAASGDSNFDVTWKIRRSGPGGPEIGRTKTTQGAYFASSTDLVGVSFNPGDIALVPGHTYYIEVTDTQGFTPYIQPSWNSYPDGRAYRRGVATGYDLAMTIVEYTAEALDEFRTHLEVIKRRRVARTLFEYECRVILQNLSTVSVRDVRLELLKVGQNMTIMEPSVTFGGAEIRAGQSATSLDTCTFSVYRTAAIDPAEIIWYCTYVVFLNSQIVHEALSSRFIFTMADPVADVSGDGNIDFADLSRLTGNWLWAGPGGAIDEDILQDGSVNLPDFAEFAQGWQSK